MGPGDVVAGRFLIERHAGSGGMGTVYRARDRAGGGVVALKVLVKDAPLDVARFSEEAAVLAELVHPAIVRYVAHGRTPGGERYLVMDWLEGEDLAARLSRGRLSLTESLVVIERVAGAIALAHRRGIVHRDLKPRNLFLPEGAIDRVMVLDFGIARRSSGGRGVSTTGGVIGTPEYMAPEQVRGTAGVDPRIDVFALGCVLFECLAGHPPFTGSHALAVMAKILLEPPPRVRSIRPAVASEIEALLQRMLSKEPGDRPADAGEVVSAIHALDRVSSLAPEPAPPPQAAITESEQRVFSVVLADGAPNAPTPEGDGERSAEAMRAAVAPFGAQVERVAGGAWVLTLHGEGEASDHAGQAARLALAVQGTLPHARVALATGRGMVQSSGAVGEVIDRGGALLARAGIGEVAVDEVATGLLGARFDIGARDGALLLRGERRLVEASRMLLGRATTCVGRAREIAVIDALLEECATEPVARAVLITGPAGIGKSRVVLEFARGIEARGQEIELLVGRGDPLTAGSPFGLVGQAIRRTAGVVDGEPLEVSRDKLRARIARTLTGPSLQRVAAFLGELGRMPFPDEGLEVLRAARSDAVLMGDAMREAWEDWLLSECGVRPVLLVLEDLHWGDLPTVKLVDAALRNLAGSPLLVVATARLEVHAAFPFLWAERGLHTMRLDELTPRASAQLVRDALGEAVAPATLERIVERAAGNAFYLEELIRAEAAGTSPEVLPDTVLGMVQARLDQLGPEAKRVLRAASVFGQRFRLGGVEALLGGERGTVTTREWLDHLVAREAIVRRNPAGGGGAAEYAFRHALVREAAYAMLTPADCTLGHRLAARWLEATGHHDPLALAEHHDRGGEPAHAASWYRRAAEHALEGNDFEAAVGRAERAVACGAAGDELGLARLVQASARAWTGRTAEAQQHAEAAVALLPRGGRAWYRAMMVLINEWARRGEYARIVSVVEGVVPREGADVDTSTRVRFLCQAAVLLLISGRRAESTRVLEDDDLIASTPESLDPSALARVHQLRATQLLYRGDSLASLGEFDAAVACFDSAGDQRNACSGLANVGFIYAELGDHDRAEAALRQVKSTADRLGLAYVSASAMQTLGTVLARRGALPEGRAIQEEAAIIFKRQGDRRLEGASRVYLSLVASKLNDANTAEHEARAATALLAETPSLRSCAFAALSRSLLLQGRIQEAVSAAKHAMEILSWVGEFEDGVALVRLAFAEALQAAGDVHAATSAIRDAAARVRLRASRIESDAIRTMFLCNIPEHERTVQLAHAWAGEDI